ncbi:hypothetical protein SNEBB_008128 [Seison nebaliae]|nr:hypothetical protein SNEBB_008128 [Seison nebaliae]
MKLKKDRKPKTEIKKGLENIPDNEFYEKRGVLYIGHLPPTFTEKAIYEYFSQFGTITRLRVSRSKISGRSKGYAFLEYEHREVAQEVSKAMNDYLLKNRFLKCHLISIDKCHVKMFKGWNRKFQTSKSSIRHKLQVNQKSDEDEEKLKKNFQKKLNIIVRKWPEIDFDKIVHFNKPIMEEAQTEEVTVEPETPKTSEKESPKTSGRTSRKRQISQVTRRSERLKRKNSIDEYSPKKIKN